jgi:hypothetical protein
MSDIKPNEQAHPDTRPLPPEKEPIGRNQAHPIRRPFLNSRGKIVRNVLLAAALAEGTIAGANLLQGNQPGVHDVQFPAPTQIIEGQNPRPTSETNPDNIRIGDLNPNHPTTKKLNGIVMIKIKEGSNLPTPRTDPSVENHEPLFNVGSWPGILEINGQPIAEAVDSNGIIELVLTDPLITSGYNPDNQDKNTGTWITVISQGKPLYFSASQETAGLVMVEPRGGNKPIFEAVDPNANALDYGHVTFKNAPRIPSGPIQNG